MCALSPPCWRKPTLAPKCPEKKTFVKPTLFEDYIEDNIEDYKVLTSLSVLVSVFMLMFSFMLWRLNRKSYLSSFFNYQVLEERPTIPTIPTITIIPIIPTILIKPFIIFFNIFRFWMKGQPGHVEAELVSKFLVNFIDFQDLDQVNLKLISPEENTSK